jgi:hypothetical protein
VDIRRMFLKAGSRVVRGVLGRVSREIYAHR